MAEVYVRGSQMIGFGDGARYGAAYHFGNPLDLEKVLEWELDRLKRGLQTRVTITGLPYKAFYQAYTALKKAKGILTLRQRCRACEGTGIITREVNKLRHWSGAQLYAFTGLVFKDREWCKSCEGAGFREFIARKDSNND